MSRVWIGVLALALWGCDAAVSPFVVASAPLARTATLGLITDAQYCDCAPEDDRHYRASLWKLEAAAEMFNSKGVDFSVHLGDLIQRDVKSFSPALDALASLDSTLLHVLGNHDYEVAEADRADVPGHLRMESRYHEHSKGLWRFIFMDGTDLSLFATSPGSARRAETDAMLDSLAASGGRTYPWNGGVGKEQLVWLRATLDDALARGQRAVVVSHFPIYPQTTHNLWNDGDVLAVLDAYPHVVAHVSGHDHHGRVSLRSGVHHIGIEGIVETRGQNAYAVAHFGVDALEIQGSGRVPSIVLPYADASAATRRSRRSRSH